MVLATCPALGLTLGFSVTPPRPPATSAAFLPAVAVAFNTDLSILFFCPDPESVLLLPIPDVELGARLIGTEVEAVLRDIKDDDDGGGGGGGGFAPIVDVLLIFVVAGAGRGRGLGLGLVAAAGGGKGRDARREVVLGVERVALDFPTVPVRAARNAGAGLLSNGTRSEGR